MIFSFHKLVGAGNDFIFVDANDFPIKNIRPEVARYFCNRTWGVGADGMVFLQNINHKKGQFLWDFYNNDGSSAEMCGNAARCAALYCFELFKIESFELETLVGIVSGKKAFDEISISWKLTSADLVKKEVKLTNEKTFSGLFINTGVPHFVLQSENMDINREDCLLIQNHKDFLPNKTNVTLLKIDKQNSHQSKSFERGVCDFTLACGTGVIACAFVLESLQKEREYSITVPGGRLKVLIDNLRVTLLGPAIKTFVGQANWNRGI